MANTFILGWLVVILHQYLALIGSGFLRLVFVVGVFLFYALFDFLPKMLFRMYPTRLVCAAGPARFGGSTCCCGPWLRRWNGFRTCCCAGEAERSSPGILFGNREELRLVMQDASADSDLRRTADD